MKRMCLLDSNSLLIPYAYAVPEMWSPDGLLINGVFGFSSLCARIVKTYQPDKLVCMFDKCTNNFRKVIDPTYKAHRIRLEPSIYKQFDLMIEVCKLLEINYYFHDEYEADDLLGSFAHYYNDYEIMIFSTDKDLLQLCNPRITIINPFKNITFDEKTVFEKYNIRPADFPQYLALCGDASDNIKGIAGVGPKTAVKIIKSMHAGDDIQKTYPKYDFAPLPIMLELTTIKTDLSLAYPVPDLHIIPWHNLTPIFGFSV